MDFRPPSSPMADAAARGCGIIRVGPSRSTLRTWLPAMVQADLRLAQRDDVAKEG